MIGAVASDSRSARTSDARDEHDSPGGRPSSYATWCRRSHRAGFPGEGHPRKRAPEARPAPSRSGRESPDGYRTLPRSPEPQFLTRWLSGESSEPPCSGGRRPASLICSEAVPNYKFDRRASRCVRRRLLDRARACLCLGAAASWESASSSSFRSTLSREALTLRPVLSNAASRGRGLCGTSPLPRASIPRRIVLRAPRRPLPFLAHAAPVDDNLQVLIQAGRNFRSRSASRLV
jgi:hypothetical protein